MQAGKIPERHERLIHMKSSLLALVLAFALPTTYAASASAESIEALLELTKAKDLVDAAGMNMESSIRQEMLEAVGNQKLTSKQKQALEVLPRKLVLAMQPEFDWSVLKPEFVRLYAETFSQEEVDGLSQFYRTPLGQAVIAKMPILQSRCMEITQARLAIAIPKIEAALASAIAEVKAAR